MGASFPYSIAAHSAWRVVTANPADRTASGSLRATPASGLHPVAAPFGLLVYSFTDGGKDRLAGRRARFAPLDRLPGPDRRRPARSAPAPSVPAWPSPTPPMRASRVSLEITRPDGSLLLPPASLALPPGGQTSRLLDQVFQPAAGLLFRPAAG